MSWAEFLRTHANLWATDFLAAHVWTSCGLVLVGEKFLLKALCEFEAHYLTERPHQGIGNSLVKRDGKLQIEPPEPNEPLEWDCRRRLGGLLKSYSRKAA